MDAGCTMGVTATDSTADNVDVKVTVAGCSLAVDANVAISDRSQNVIGSCLADSALRLLSSIMGVICRLRFKIIAVSFYAVTLAGALIGEEVPVSMVC